MRLGIRPGNIFTILVGLLFVGAGIYAYIAMGRSLATAREASGVVVELVYESGTRKGRIHPVVRFKTDEGQEFVGRSHQHSNVQVGQTVQFVYDANRPDDIEIVTLERVKGRRLVIVALSLLVGLIVCAVGVGFDTRTLQWRWGKPAARSRTPE